MLVHPNDTRDKPASFGQVLIRHLSDQRKNQTTKLKFRITKDKRFVSLMQIFHLMGVPNPSDK